MSRIEESIIVDVPVSTAYNQWTQFEKFPYFMNDVEMVTQLNDKTLHWVAHIGGVRREWTATIMEQIPDTRIVWRAEQGEKHVGMVRFEPASDGRTRVFLSMEYEPRDFAEKAADTLGIITRRIERDLERFKEFIEQRGVETGAWRGEIHPGRMTG